ncbi:Threonine synthase-like 2 [Orchesella cincta]|uniref:Threonine synthase-like 2 n=1 Tax=Orchesella cincta TaxID=48709 RepID=A0A1D2N2D0_ORCCI|nr:Threonine synthase-like 2 [Orchesella cincta]
MKYKSTRGGAEGSSFEDALFSGYASDGGLYVPEVLPVIPKELLSSWKTSPPSYQQVVLEVVKLFVGEDEIPLDVLETCINQAYKEFDTSKVIEIQDCKDANGSNYRVVELFHGKTKSFKDYALSLVGRLLQYFVSKRNSHATILVGTSGDTGSAAIEAVKGLKGLDIIVLYPKGKISEVQELQMISVTEDNVHVFATEGTSDDLDVPIKKSFPAPGLMSINSINWARIMIQIAHYVYLSTLEQLQPIDIYVPTGAAGNLSAGLLASLMGVPVNLYSATNLNDTVALLINKGKLAFGGTVLETYSNAMDIRHPYNCERVLYFLSDSQTVASIMKNEEEYESVIPVDLHEKLRKYIKGALKVDTPTTLETIRECWKLNKYMICPHTATAVAFCTQQNKEKVGETSKPKPYVIATASPEKFPDAAIAAELPSIDCNYNLANGLLQKLKSRERKEPKQMKKGENWFQILQAEISLVTPK